MKVYSTTYFHERNFLTDKMTAGEELFTLFEIQPYLFILEISRFDSKFEQN